SDSVEVAPVAVPEGVARNGVASS
ncbi:hypothetical protein A2U01_0109754, partial [Trifolium medium]|nr:hypothetical protein [Trifolium medium]